MSRFNNQGYDTGPIMASRVDTDTALFSGGVLSVLDDNVQKALETLDTWGSGLDSVYLRLDAANSPVTGALDIQNTLSALRVEVTGDNIYHNVAQPLTGLSEYQQSLNVIVDGADIYMETEKVGGGDLEYIFDAEEYDLDCTTGAGTGGMAQVGLTEGTATAPRINYVYVNLVGGVATLQASTSVPTGEFAWHSIVVLQDSATVNAHGPINLQRTTEALAHNGRGALSYMREKLRWLGPKYVSGCASVLSGTTTIELAVASGVVFQLHRQTFPSRAVVADGITVCNASGAGVLAEMANIHDLNDFAEIADGTSISPAKYFSGTVWATMASSDQNGNQSKLFLNLPTNVYSSESAAIADSSNYDVRTAPSEYNNTAFLVARVVFKKTSGDHTIVGVYSLLGSPMGTIGGGAGSTALTEFDDSFFKVYDNGDPTKIIDLEASAITTGNARTITMADADVDLADIALNTAKVTNATHTGEVTGATALTLDKTAISNQADTVITASDTILFGDATDTNALKKDTVQGILDLISEEVNNFSYETVATGVTVTIPTYQQMIVDTAITIDGTLIEDGNLVLI